MHAVDIQANRRVIHILRNVDLADSRQLMEAAGKILRRAVSKVQIARVDLHVDGRGHARIEDGVHHRAALEKGADIGKFGGQIVLDLFHVIQAAHLMALIQSRLNGGGVHSGVGGIERREVVHHSDIRNDHLEFRGRDIVPDQVLDFGRRTGPSLQCGFRWALSR